MWLELNKLFAQRVSALVRDREVRCITRGTLERSLSRLPVKTSRIEKCGDINVFGVRNRRGPPNLVIPGGFSEILTYASDILTYISDCFSDVQ